MSEHRVEFDDTVAVNRWSDDGTITLTVDDHEHFVQSQVHLTPAQARAIAANLNAQADAVERSQQ